MNRWQRLYVVLPLVFSIMEKAEAVRGLSGTALHDAIGALVDDILIAVEAAVGRDLVNNVALHEALRNAFLVPNVTP
jgi:hypothetical protein